VSDDDRDQAADRPLDPQTIARRRAAMRRLREELAARH
jgi:hypothetical protein